MFGIDFYPTPESVVIKMLEGVLVSDKVVLEPSAGKGNIVDYCNYMGAKQVLACEIDPNLRTILSAKCNLIKSDFIELTAEQISHVDLIIMNPPFSKQEEHILHAWDIAPAGCQIISLCNSSMITTGFSKQRESIKSIIKTNGRSENYGDCFSNSERKTGVSVSCVWLFKPGSNESEFDGYFDLYDYEQDEINQSGIVRYDFVQDIVSRYVESVSMFDAVDAASKRINQSIKGVVEGFNISFGAKASGRDNEYKEITREIFKKELQKAAWEYLFKLMKMDRYVTTGVKSEINKFVEQQTNYPFTVKNVYLMIQMVIGTHGERMGKVICEAFDIICGYSYENSTAGEGWRTNTDFLINKRFILPHMTEFGYRSGFRIHHSRGEKMNDVVKALCHLTGTRYEDQVEIYSFFCNSYRVKCDGKWCQSYDACDSSPDSYRIKNYRDALIAKGHDAHIVEVDREWGKWVDWNEFFIVRAYKKGTLHVEFKSEDVWLKFNQRVAEIRGWSNMVAHSKQGRSKKSR